LIPGNFIAAKFAKGIVNALLVSPLSTAHKMNENRQRQAEQKHSQGQAGPA
jgi:hypothetical protein